MYIIELCLRKSRLKLLFLGSNVISKRIIYGLLLKKSCSNYRQKKKKKNHADKVHIITMIRISIVIPHPKYVKHIFNDLLINKTDKNKIEYYCLIF